MKNSLFFICFITISFFSNAQINKNAIEEETQRYHTLLSQNTKTLVINLSGFSMNFIGNFKDELIGWQGKVLSVTIDENTRIISVVHNQLLEPKEINDILKKFQIAKDLIISHH